MGEQWTENEICNVTCSPLYNSRNQTILESPQLLYPYDIKTIEQFCNKNSSFAINSYCLMQVYKIRKESNMTLATYLLGNNKFNNL